MKIKMFKISKFMISAVAMLQLAISQVHIKVITKVFDSTVGFYLFLFVLFGLVMAFNLSSMKKESKVAAYIVTTLLAISSGIWYVMLVFKDIATGKHLTMEIARLSLIVSIVALVIFTIGSVIVLMTKERDKSGAA